MNIRRVAAWHLTFGVAALGLAACGSEEKEKAAPEDAGGTGGSGGTTGTGGSSAGGAGPLLADDTAGNACTANSDCAPRGTCASTLTGGTIAVALGPALATTGGYCTGECAADLDCGAGAVCFGAVPNPLAPLAGECRKTCSADADCRDGYECASQLGPIMGVTATLPKTCQPKPVLDHLTDEVGKACGADAGTGVCGDGSCTEGPTFPGGYCTGVCLADADCGTDGVCVPGLYGSQGSCWERCTTDGDCARDQDGYGCITLGTKQVCSMEQEPLPAGAVGTACTGNAACAPGTCASTLPSANIAIPPLAAPGGYCTQNCLNADACGSGGACVLFSCLKRCTTSADCARAGYVCEARGLPVGDGGTALVCVPPTPTDGGVVDAAAD